MAYPAGQIFVFCLLGRSVALYEQKSAFLHKHMCCAR